jgi:hypothetical protein
VGLPSNMVLFDTFLIDLLTSSSISQENVNLEWFSYELAMNENLRPLEGTDILQNWFDELAKIKKIGQCDEAVKKFESGSLNPRRQQ